MIVADGLFGFKNPIENNDLVAEREGFEPSIRFCRILTFQASAFDHSATAPHRWGSALAPIAGVRPALNANAVSLDLPKMAILQEVSCDRRGAL